jgi:hypothetical protein
MSGGTKRTQAVHCTAQRHWDASGAGSALGCPSARHSLPVTSGCSVVQNGASSACLNRLSLRARSQLSSPALSSGHFSVEVQSAPADCLQRKGLFPALARVGRMLDDLDDARLQDLHRPARDTQARLSVPSVRSGDGPALRLSSVPRQIPLQGARPGVYYLAELPRWRWTSAFSSCAAA